MNQKRFLFLPAKIVGVGDRCEQSIYFRLIFCLLFIKEKEENVKILSKAQKSKRVFKIKPKMIRIFFILFIFTISTAFQSKEKAYVMNKGEIVFKSEASLEVIEAKSDQLEGSINISERTFEIMIDISSFEGFSSPLYKRLFNENYMESGTYQKASFKGKRIENKNLNRNGNYTLRAKGKLNIHGVEQERIIKSNVTVKDGVLKLESVFTVFLHDHNITLPKIVQQKISEEIQVRVKGEMMARN